MVILFAIFNSNFRESASIDGLGNSLLPVSLIVEQDFDLDEFKPLLENQHQDLWAAAHIFGAFQQSNSSHATVNSYPPGAALLSVPVYLILSPFLDYDNFLHIKFAAKISASLLTALAAGFVFLNLRMLGGSYTSSLMLTTAFGLGSAAWSLASQGLWQHAPGMLSLSLAIFALLKLHDSHHKGWAFLAGLALAMAVVSRNLNAIPAICLSLWMLLEKRDALIPFALPAVVGALLLFNLNFAYFGNITGGHEAIYHSAWHGWRGLNSSNVFQVPLLEGLANIYFSPSEGLLIYSPWLIAAVCLSIQKIRSAKFLCIALIIWCVLISILLAKNALWWGGTGFGSRYTLEMTVAATLLVGLALQNRSLLSHSICAGLIVYSMAVHCIGAFYAPCDWDLKPVSSDRHVERYWEWHDPEILRCASSGITNGPIKFEFLAFFGQTAVAK